MARPRPDDLSDLREAFTGLPRPGQERVARPLERGRGAGRTGPRNIVIFAGIGLLAYYGGFVIHDLNAPPVPHESVASMDDRFPSSDRPLDARRIRTVAYFRDPLTEPAHAGDTPDPLTLTLSRDVHALTTAR